MVSEDYARYTGGWTYNERLLAELEARGWRVERQILPAGFPLQSEELRGAVADRLAALSDDSIVLIDQICISLLPDVAAAEADRLRLAIIVHHPLASEGYRSPIDLEALEREALQSAWRIITTSDATADTLRTSYGVDGGRLVMAPPGTDLLPLSNGSDGDAPALLSVGAVVPRKGHDILFRALSRLAHLPWTLSVVGDTARRPEHVRALRAFLKREDLEERIRLTGALSSAEDHWQRADLYVSSSRHEGYGMAVSEAVRRGLPVITTRAGAVVDWLDPSAAIIVDDRYGNGLAGVLESILQDPKARARLRRSAIEWSATLPSWSASIGKVHNALAASF